MSNLIDNIKASEGFRSKVYKCTAGHDTIGYGFAIKDLVLSKGMCDKILESKVAELKLRIDQKFPFVSELPEIVQDVVIEMCYQMGVSGFSKFKKTIDHLMRNDFPLAAKEMLDSRWAVQTPNRANRLSNYVKNAR